ncbi:MAG: DUF72 domain-containing protein [Aquificaceae bacterium]|nr:DUF72 domain-containing protein [Aquificaceae bacterium]MDW8032673.1 DUF72 domain-containing protein [Aquificaceae bacterium]MDW8295100.1 DUF72 domain-containing protein [Aquificaceae bacterium]
MKVYVGCSGFFYRDWVGVFYPPFLKREDYIRFYARYFEVVEINSSFYAFPNRGAIKSMLSRTSSLRLSFKAHRSFTHARRYTSEEVKKFLHALEPALEEERFIALLFQFPESFGYGEESIGYLKKLSEDFRGLRKVVEVRNRSFKKQDFYQTLEELGFSLVNTDAPKGGGFLVGPWVSVGAINYIRLHGKEPDKPYDYLYSLEELKRLKDKLKKLGKAETYLFFNNTTKGQAILNALQFKLLLGIKTEIPQSLQKSFKEREWE